MKDYEREYMYNSDCRNCFDTQYTPDTKSKTNTTPNRRSRKMRYSRLINAATASTIAIASVFGTSFTPSAVSAFVEQPAASCRGKLPNPATKSRTLGYMTLEQVSDFYQNFPIQSAVLTCGVKASVADTIAQVKPQIEENNQQQQQQQQQELELPSIRATDSRHEPHSLQSAIHLNFNNNNVNDIIRGIDWEARRNLAYVLYGGIFVGLMSHLEYSCVFPFLFGMEKTTAITIEKVCFDNLIAAPLMWLPPAYFIKAWMYGMDSESCGDDEAPKGILAEGLEKYLIDVKENQLLWKYWAIWFPAQSVSFSVVPDHLRVAFMASISFFWFILFSTVSSQGDKSAPSTINTATK